MLHTLITLADRQAFKPKPSYGSTSKGLDDEEEGWRKISFLNILIFNGNIDSVEEKNVHFIFSCFSLASHNI